MTNVLITGANRGLGLALATRFVSRPDTQVIATTRDAANAGDLQALRARGGDRVDIVVADVADAASIDALAASIATGGRTIDVLINNAGMANWSGIGAIAEAEIAEILRVNAIGPVLVTQALLPHLRDGGKIVNMTSQLGSIANVGGSSGLAYGMSKAALNMFTVTLAQDVKPRGIAVLSLHPGWVRTRMGGSGATLTTDQSVDGMLAVIDRLSAATSGSYLAYDGSTLPW